MNKKLIIAVAALIVIGAAVAIYFAAFHNPVISEFTIKTGAAKGGIIPLPPGSRHIDVSTIEMEYFETNYSASDINQFYEDYTRGFQKVRDEKHAPSQVFYYDEEQRLVFWWEVVRERDNGLCQFSIVYDDYSSEDYKPIK